MREKSALLYCLRSIWAFHATLRHCEGVLPFNVFEALKYKFGYIGIQLGALKCPRAMRAAIFSRS